MARGCAVIALVSLLIGSTAVAGDWSRFRGPNGSGVSDSTGLPTEFGPGENEYWATEIPFGRSSPVIGGSRIFLTAVENGDLVTLALDRDSGGILWQRSVPRSHTAELHNDTDSSTPTPATDGENVYAFFHEAGLVSYDAAGKERWRRPLGPFRNFYGCASSPVVAAGLVLVICDQAEGSFLLAVDADSGEVRWRKNRSARLEGYATPILAPSPAEPKLVVVSGSRWVDAYDLTTGEDAWSLPGVGSGPVSSPVLVGDTLYVNAHDHAEGGWSPFESLLKDRDADGDGTLSREEAAGFWLENHFGWVDADADGAVSAEDWKSLGEEMVNDNFGVYALRLSSIGGTPEKLWNYRQNLAYIPSPLVHEGVFYMVKDGIVTSLDAATGDLHKRGRLGGSNKVYASPVAADGKIFIATLEGRVVILTASPEWEVVAENEIGEPIHGTPAIVDGTIYVRTESKLHAFGKPANEG